MKSKFAKPSFINDSSRCQHTTQKGRCRMPAVDPSRTLCFDHARAALQARDHTDFSAALTRESAGFQTAEGINYALGDLYLLLAQGRISPRRAATLAYISNLLLRTLPAIDADRSPRAYRLIGAAVPPTPISESVTNPLNDTAVDDTELNDTALNDTAVNDTAAVATPAPRPVRQTPLPPGKTPLPATLEGFLKAVKEVS